MNVKEFVARIINKNKNQINQRIKSIPKLLSVGLVSVIGLVPLTSIPNRGIAAYAQQIQQGQLDSATATADPLYESLEIARSKVQVALSPGAFGHGVPDLYGLSTSEILMALGIPVVGGIVTFLVVRKLINRAKKDVVMFQ